MRLSKPIPRIAVALAVLVAISGGFVLWSGAHARFHRSIADRGPTLAKPLVMRFDETSRTANTSTVRVMFESGTSVASAMWIMQCNVELAEERGARHFVVLRSWDGDGATWYLVGFADQPYPDPAQHFGIGESPAVEPVWHSVDELRRLLRRSE